jgi:hypothetical protein
MKGQETFYRKHFNRDDPVAGVEEGYPFFSRPPQVHFGAGAFLVKTIGGH